MESSPEEDATQGSARFAGFEVVTQCRACGNGLALNGPVLEVSCDDCQQPNLLPSSLWTSLLEDFEEAMTDPDRKTPQPGQFWHGTTLTSGYTLKTTTTRQSPACGRCGTEWPATTEGDRQLICTGCGRRASTFPAPEWLVAELPSARQIFDADREGDRISLAADAIPQPVSMACPQCGGNLRITPESPRITRCEYCSNDIYLPPAIWQRFHPVRTSRRWYVRFEDETAAELERERAIAQQREQRRQARVIDERRAARKARAKNTTSAEPSAPHSSSTKRSGKAWRIVLILLLLIGALIGWGLLR